MSGDLSKFLALAETGAKSRARRKPIGVTTIAAGVLALLLVGCGAYLFTNRAELMDRLSGYSAADQTTATTAPEQTPTVAAMASGKGEPVKDNGAVLTQEWKKAPEAEPAFTDPKMRQSTEMLRAIDVLIKTGKLDEAKSSLDGYVKGDHSDFHLAEAYYRLGLVARKQGREEDAQGNWDRAYSAFPETRCGRLSALVIADGRFAQYCGKSPKYSEWEEVRDLYSCVMGSDNAPFLDEQTRNRVVMNLNSLNSELIFGNAPLSCAQYYTVAKGDLLGSIARKYGLHYDSIKSVNGILDERSLREGQKLKIIKAECSIVVDKTNLTLTWYLGGKWVKQYRCCVGPDNKTPAGSYVIEVKDAKPDWTNPATHDVIPYGDPRNILGTRWMALKGNRTVGLGIHGTGLPESIPGRTSNGCVRLLNADVEELYGFALIGTKVEIRE